MNSKNITTINQITNLNKDLNNNLLGKNEEITLLKNKLLGQNNEINLLQNKIINLQKKNDELTKPKEIILIGLNNIGATCYMNATLQCLSNTKPLKEYFLNYKDKPNNIMANEYLKLIINLWDKKRIINHIVHILLKKH